MDVFIFPRKEVLSETSAGVWREKGESFEAERGFRAKERAGDCRMSPTPTPMRVLRPGQFPPCGCPLWRARHRRFLARIAFYFAVVAVLCSVLRERTWFSKERAHTEEYLTVFLFNHGGIDDVLKLFVPDPWVYPNPIFTLFIKIKIQIILTKTHTSLHRDRQEIFFLKMGFSTALALLNNATLSESSVNRKGIPDADLTSERDWESKCVTHSFIYK